MSTIDFHATRRGVLAHFAADQCIAQSLRRYGEWAENEITLLRPYLGPGDTALDVGANVGTHTLAFAEFVGPTGRVIAIEGQLSTFALLGHNVLVNGLAEVVTALPVLAGAEPALVESSLTPPSDNVGAKSFFPDVHGRSIHGVPVHALPPRPKGLPVKLALITVDSLQLSDCALMKVDVEGMELDVLLGSRETLERTRPVVYFEQAAGAASGLGEIQALLRGLGYRLFRHLTPAFNPQNFKGSADNIFGDATELNILAVPEGAAIPAGLDEIV
ncbi:FkbM family methyltransferase [Methylobacterium trifolii]|uniref:Methyltransferase FkbM domain-containing protein n=1 Tax=Methylobacterium trifolii TaxID=1003092 RepID=A0ABQ4U127_9HYPH|nr:FkbM family methyltransferase [Methylobacterium trifolii]GJE61180.1 hypothetical protein MPOCJGCO_3301 [Methylobacterium trifolii]